MKKHNGGETRGNKRRYGGKGSQYGPAPRRGPPALFVSCESGREKKCQREALELIHHYYYASRPALLQNKTQSSEGKIAPSPTPLEEVPLSLDEELSMLRRGATAEEVIMYEPNSKRPRNGSKNATSKQLSSMKSPFSIYDTGMRGMVCILCTVPGCEMIPYDDILAEIRVANEKKEGKNTANVATGKEDGNEDNSKAIMQNDTTKTKESKGDDGNKVSWDPVETVRCILRDVKGLNQNGGNNDDESDGKGGVGQGNNEKEVSKELSTYPAPGSRFILRLLPMQATCYASVEEIKAVCTSLLKRILPNSPAIMSKQGKEITFKVEIKMRLCSHLKKGQVIEAVAPIVMDNGLREMPGYKFTVNLSDPDFSIRIEVCKTLVGVSILPREEWYKNFNLAELTNPTLDDKK